MRWLRVFLTSAVDMLIILMAFFFVELLRTEQLADMHQARAETVQGQLDEEQRTGTALRDANEELTETIGTLSYERNTAIDQGEKLRVINDELDKENKGLRDQLDWVTTEGQTQRDRMDGQERELADARDIITTLKTANDELKGKLRTGPPVTLLLMPDLTQSMAEPLEMMRATMATLFEVLPNTSSDFRMGVLGFRDGVVATFDVTPILPTYEDGGRSQAAALDFLNQLSLVGAMTDHLPVFERAIETLENIHPGLDPERRIRIVFVGDVGPSEVDGQEGYSSVERQRKSQILTLLQRWASHGNRGIDAFYVENNWVIAKDPARVENRAWFQAVGSVSPESQFYEDASHMLRAILQTSLPRDKRGDR
ncbi:MAG: hypothetical protein KDA86_15975 [Planctomycetaceae bacterium]|nr:hypothetical protein [Planctomycetaceae bacterium]